MAKKGTAASIEARPAVQRDPAPLCAALYRRVPAGLWAAVFLMAVALPVTFDTASLSPAIDSALAAGNGNGDGQGRGNGNGKGRGDEKGGGKRPGGGGGDDDDDDDHDDDDHGGSDPSGDDHGDDRGDDRGDVVNDGGHDDIGGANETESAEAIADVVEPNQEAVAGPAASALPTIHQVFSLGEDAVLNSEQELLAIKNGWNSQN